MVRTDSNSLVTDMTRGMYRRIYAGFIRGRRICAISLGAEAWFWRINAIVDDFGNTEADGRLLASATIGRRTDVDVAQVELFRDELVAARLLQTYEADGEHFLHVANFHALQPGGKNGKRIRRFAASPWEDGSNDTVARLKVNPGESRCIQKNPEKPRTHHYQNQNQNQNQNQKDKNAAHSSGTAAEASDPAEPPLMVFPTVGGRSDQSREWGLTPAHVAELAEAYPDLDIVSESRKALVWIRANSPKTAGGMRKFLAGWMSRAQNSGRGRPHGSGIFEPKQERNHASNHHPKQNGTRPGYFPAEPAGITVERLE